MMSFRRHLRLLAFAWLILQGATLLAFVPRDCCKAHRPVAGEPHCVQAANGPPGAATAPDAPSMHHVEATRPGPAESAPREDVMQGSCGVPAVFAVFANPGVLPATVTATATASVSMSPRQGDVRPLAMSRPPYERPPRT